MRSRRPTRVHSYLRLLALVALLLLAPAGYAPDRALAAPPAVQNLEFNGSDGGYAGSGFNTVLPGTVAVESALSLGGGKLRIAASQGDLAPSATAQDNALAISYTSSGAYTIGARLLKPQFGGAYQSAGIFVGKSSSQYIRFTAGFGSKGSLGERLQLDVMDTNGKLRSTTIALPPGTLASVQNSLDLFLNIDHAGNGKITALYRIDSDSASDGRLATSRAFPRWLRQGNNVTVYSGILATNRGAALPLAVDFDWFRVSTAAQVVAIVSGEKLVDKDGSSPGQTVSPGDTLTYTINVKNNGTATSVQVADPIPADTAYLPASATNGASYDPATNRVVLQLGSLAGGTSYSFSFKVTINPAPLQSATIVNTASVTSGSSPLPSLLSAQTVVSGVPDLTDSTYAVSPASVGPGGTLTYALSLLNDGTAPASGATAKLLVPAGTSLVAGSAKSSLGKVSVDPSLTSIDWSWTRATPLAIGETAAITFMVGVGGGFANGAPIVSQATMQAINAQTNIESAQAIFTAQATVVGSKTVDKAQALRGDTLTYAISVANYGATPATNLQVVDPLPRDTTFVNGSLSTPIVGSAAIDAGKRTVTWSIPSLAPNASATITVSASINQLLHSAVILNQASLTNPSASVQQTLLSAQTIVQGAADLSGSIYTASPGQVSAAGTVTYTLSLLSNGTAAASNATAKLTIPSGTTLVANSASASRGALVVNTALNTITWTADGPLPIGTIVKIGFRAKVSSAVAGGYASTATLQADGTAPIDQVARALFVQSAPDHRTVFVAVVRR